MVIAPIRASTTEVDWSNLRTDLGRFEEYWHMDETAMRFRMVTPRIVRGVKNNANETN